MARIRSIHPGIWTDEAFVEMSRDARLFFIGIWNEADDCGLIEWRPTRLKMRLAPADQLDAESVMEEIVSFGFLVRFERGGKEYAAVKNFRKFQRPKNPSAPILPLDDEIMAIVGLQKDPSPTPSLPQPLPERAEKSPQMEDGGWRGKEDKEAKASSSSADDDEGILISEAMRRLEQATGWLGLPGEGAIQKLLDEGISFEGRILPLAKDEAERRTGPPKGWSYIAAVVRDKSRQPTPSAKEIETAWVPVGSGVWKALCGVKRESFLRQMAKPGPGGEGIYWPVSDLPRSGQQPGGAA